MAKRRTMRKAKSTRMSKKAMRRSTKKRGKKTARKKGKKKLTAWNKQVQAAYKSLKKTNPNATLGDAMKKASKDKKKNRPLSMSVSGGGPPKKTIEKKRPTRPTQETPLARQKRQRAEADALGSGAVADLKRGADRGDYDDIKDFKLDDG